MYAPPSQTSHGVAGDGTMLTLGCAETEGSGDGWKRLKQTVAVIGAPPEPTVTPLDDEKEGEEGANSARDIQGISF